MERHLIKSNDPMQDKTASALRTTKYSWAGKSWVFCAVLLIGIFFRFYNIDKKVYWYDETITSLQTVGYSTSEMSQLLLQTPLLTVRDLWKFQHINSGRGLTEVVHAIAVDDPQHPPLYFILLHLWMRTFGDDVTTVRMLSVLFGILVIPAMYWLARELLFESPHAYEISAWATMLVAISPFHLLYAQEAREYSMWTVTILVSSALLVRALRQRVLLPWIMFMLSVAVGMYTFTLFAFVCAAHTVYVLAMCLPLRRWKTLIAYGLTLTAGMAAFTPWAIIIANQLALIGSRTSWATTDFGLIRLAAMWGFNFSSIFFDTDHSLKFVTRFGAEVLATYMLRGVVLLIVFVALVLLGRRAERNVRWFVFSIIAIPFIGLALPDLIGSGIRSGGGNRYLIPCYLGVELATAYILAVQLKASQYSITLRIWQGMAGFLVICGFTSCVFVSQAEVWWIKPVSYYVPRIARRLNREPQPLLLIGTGGNLLAFSHVLKPETQILLSGGEKFQGLAKDYSAVFIYYPSNSFRAQLEPEHHNVKVVDKRGGLWQITPR